MERHVLLCVYSQFFTRFVASYQAYLEQDKFHTYKLFFRETGDNS